jgi:hypothetical protein
MRRRFAHFVGHKAANAIAPRGATPCSLTAARAVASDSLNHLIGLLCQALFTHRIARWMLLVSPFRLCRVARPVCVLLALQRG